MSLTNKKGDIIPMIGLGTYPFQGRIMTDMILDACKIGYRLFDTSDDYRGEAGIGIAVSELHTIGLAREDIFLQTKISDNNAYADEPFVGIYFNPDSEFMKRHTVEEIVREKVQTSLLEMKTDYLDSLLIHYPFPKYMVDIWKTMIKLREEGILRYIGVSNFHERHIEILKKETGILPQINECYTSPIGIKQSLINYCNSNNCLFMTYSPLMDLSTNKINTSNLSKIGLKYGKTPAQIILRWNIERGCLPLPKSRNHKRIEENFNVFDFSLTKDEINYLSSMNQDYQYLVESKICPGL
jgi:diketogulonate reductase-like aldo/keto reductase